MVDLWTMIFVNSPFIVATYMFQPCAQETHSGNMPRMSTASRSQLLSLETLSC